MVKYMRGYKNSRENQNMDVIERKYCVLLNLHLLLRFDLKTSSPRKKIVCNTTLNGDLHFFSTLQSRCSLSLAICVFA